MSFAFLPVAPSLLPVALLSPAAQAGEAGRRQRPVGFGVGDAAAGAQHGMRPGQLMGRGADVHVGVVEHEVVEVDQLTVEPQAGRGVGEVGAGDKAVADRALGEPLVEPGERIFGGGERVASDLGFQLGELSCCRGVSGVLRDDFTLRVSIGRGRCKPCCANPCAHRPPRRPFATTTGCKPNGMRANSVRCSTALDRAASRSPGRRRNCI